MRGFLCALGVVLAVAACAPRAEPDGVAASGSSGMVGALALRGQVVVSHPPGTREAVEQLRREAAVRCPDGFVIRRLHTGELAPTNIMTYEAVIDCNPPPAAGGRR
jgi:hypothetical protein